MQTQRARIVKGGRLILPAAFRRALALADGDTVVIELDQDEMRVRSVGSAFARLQNTVAQHVPAGVSLAGELTAERRAEAARD
jgi:bifunctional DNA-binding transcriptional regulator/antitoxin component of YhaV-PrlF toxin-antitoxin module